MAPSLITEETKKQLREHDKGWRTKVVLRTVATFFDFIAMVLFIVSVRMTLHWEDTWNDGVGGDWPDGLPLAPILISLLYNPSALFILLRHREGRAYHPGWNVGFDLIIWALAVPSIVFSVGDGWFWWWQPVLLEFGDLVPCNQFNFWSKTCQPTIYTIGRIEIAANVFLGLILVIHFTLFVMACAATRKWRREAKKAITERRNIELQYHRSPEQHTAQQPPAYRGSDTDKDIEANNGAGSDRIEPRDKDVEANNGTALRYS